jgi:hypothetical protein
VDITCDVLRPSGARLAGLQIHRHAVHAIHT